MIPCAKRSCVVPGEHTKPASRDVTGLYFAYHGSCLAEKCFAIRLVEIALHGTQLSVTDYIRERPRDRRGPIARMAVRSSLATGNIMRGWCLSTLGRFAEGIPLLLQGIAAVGATGAKLVMPQYLTILAEACGPASQPENGLRQLDDAEQLMETTKERWAEAEMHRLRGTLLLSMHEEAAAEDSYRTALTVARQQSAKLWELRAALDISHLWRSQGKTLEARDVLVPVCDWFTEGVDVPVLLEARALL
jgi:predicted ATPase